MVKINISLNKKLLREFEEVLKDRGYHSRSKAIRDAIKDYIIRYKWIKEMEGERTGLILVIYNPHLTSTIKNLTDIQLTDIQYDFRKYIECGLYVHIAENQCLEVIIVKGDIEYIKNFTGEIIKIKGVDSVKLTSSPIEDNRFNSLDYSQ